MLRMISLDQMQLQELSGLHDILQREWWGRYGAVAAGADARAGAGAGCLATGMNNARTRFLMEYWSG